MLLIIYDIWPYALFQMKIYNLEIPIHIIKQKEFWGTGFRAFDHLRHLIICFISNEIYNLEIPVSIIKQKEIEGRVSMLSIFYNAEPNRTHKKNTRINIHRKNWNEIKGEEKIEPEGGRVDVLKCNHLVILHALRVHQKTIKYIERNGEGDTERKIRRSGEEWWRCKSGQFDRRCRAKMLQPLP